MFKERIMGRKHFQPEQIISKLREAEVLLAKGDTVGQSWSIIILFIQFKVLIINSNLMSKSQKKR